MAWCPTPCRSRLQAELARLGPTGGHHQRRRVGRHHDRLRRMDRDVPEGADLCIVALGDNDMMLKT